MRSRSWVMIFVIAIVIAGAVSFLVLLYLGSFLPDSGGLTFGEKVGLIEIEGSIWTSSPTVDEILQFARNDDIRAIVVRIESPGGVVAAAQEIYEELNKVSARGKPIVASMGGIAASGAYYIACGADSIVANPGTLTGSIGVIMRFPQAEELLRKIGIGFEVVKTGEYKDIGSISRPLTREEKLLLGDLIEDVHEQFVSVIALERNMEREEVLEFADGRLFTGRQAFEIGLVDTLGDFRDAVKLAAKMAGIDGEPVIVRPRRRVFTIWDVIEDLLATASKVTREGISLEYSIR